MPHFRFDAFDSDGREIHDVVDAPSQDEALSIIRARGLYPTSIALQHTPVEVDESATAATAGSAQAVRQIPNLFLGGAAMVCLWVLAQLGEYSLFLLPLVFGLFFAIIVLKNDLGLFAAVAVILFYPLLAVRQTGPDNLDLFDLLFAISLAGFVGFSFRFLDDWQLIEQASDKKRSLQPFGGRWYYIAVAILLSLFVFWIFPTDVTSQFRNGLPSHITRLIYVGWFLVFSWLVISAVFSMTLWWRMDRHQAGVHLRSVLANELDPELTSIERRRARFINNKMGQNLKG